jgi:hypothetical protein
MIVYFHNFWDGFKDGTGYIFLKILSDVFQESMEFGDLPDKSDILVETIFGSDFLVKKKEWKYTFLFSGESYYYPGDLIAYSCILGFTHTHSNFVECPLFIICMLENKEYTYDPYPIIPESSAGCLISNGGGIIRNKFLDELEKKMKVNYGGSFRNNIGYTVKGGNYSDEVLAFFRQHRFVITMENSKEEHYITEKILNGLRAGIIPVYWGSSNITKYFNPKRFLQIENDSEEEIQHVIDKMIKMTEDEYQQIIHEPVFINSFDIVYSTLISAIHKCIIVS